MQDKCAKAGHPMTPETVYYSPTGRPICKVCAKMRANEIKAFHKSKNDFYMKRIKEMKGD